MFEMEYSSIPQRLWNRNYVAILVANCLISTSFFIVNPTFPIYVKNLLNDLGLVGLLSSIFLISAMLVRPISGYITDRYDKGKIFLAGLLLLCVSFLGYILIHSIPGIVIARLLHGIGMGLSTTAFGALVSENVPDSRMGEGMGYYGLGMVLGMSVGPALGLALLNAFNAQVVFGVAAGFVALGGLLFVGFYRKKANLEKHLPIPAGQNKRFFSLILEKSALIPASLIFFIGIVISSINTYLALYAAERGIGNIGFFFAVQSVAVLLSRLINGKLADRRGYAIVIIPSILALVGSMVVLFYAETPILFMVTAFLYGLGYGTLTSACQALAVIKAKPECRGLAISTYFLGIDAGSGLGTIINGMISQVYGYANMFLLGTIPLFIGLLIYTVWGRRLHKRRRRANVFP